MKKSFVLSLLVLNLTLVLSSCNKSSNNGGGNNPTDDDTNKVTFVDDVTIAEEDKIADMTLSGLFLDLAIGQHLVVGNEYYLNMSDLPSSFVGEPVFDISDESVFTIEKVKTGSYKLKVLKEGGAILIIKDEEDIYYYRNAVNCRNKVSVEDLLNYFVNEVSYFTSVYYATETNNYKLVFTDSSNAVLEATELGVYYGYTYLELTYEGESVVEEYDEYKFSLLYETENEANTLAPSWMNISVVGDIIHLGDDDYGTYDWFVPVIV